MTYKLTIGMPVFNDVEFIERSLKSLLNQTFHDFKLIISDDGSTDGSQLICEKYASIDKRIIYIRQPKNLGISRNMQFLLTKGESKYFMWAGDDDLYDRTFIEKHISILEDNDSVSVFCNFAIIDEENNNIKTYKDFNYNNSNRVKRLKNFIRNAHDAFGYGIFKTAYIKDVEFPIWWWPNKKSPYNNIYPTLCFYLTKGDYLHIEGEPLFFKRIKTGKNIHHLLTGENEAIKESLAFWIRRFNLVIFSTRMIRKAGNIFLSIGLFPSLFYHWFLIPSIKQFNLAASSFFKKTNLIN